MKVEVRATPLAPWRELASYEEAHPELAGGAGAASVFVGSMRDSNAGDSVTGMTLEHYPGMTEREMLRLCEEARDRWSLLDLLVVHRVGALLPGDPIVLVAVWSTHRREAFEAARHLMEQLKSTVPFWKQEQTDAGRRWVEKNTPGY